MKPQAFDAAAAAEFDEAVDYYEAQEEELGARLRTEVGRVLDRASAAPQFYHRVGRTAYRKCKVRGFPYFIYYLERPDHIWIAAVSHGSRRPSYWRGRTPPD